MTTKVSRPTVLSSEALVAHLAKYSFQAADLTTWKEPPNRNEGVQLTLHVQGHHETSGHTQYVLVCRLMKGGAVFLEWNAQRRLAELREELHDPVKREMGVQAYNTAFRDTPFAQRGGMKGTTLRLNSWCSALATSVSSGDVPPVLVSMLLQFLEAPEPPEKGGQARRQSGGGTEHDEMASIDAQYGTAVPLTVENLQPRKWRVRGRDEDAALAWGIRALWSALGFEEDYKAELEELLDEDAKQVGAHQLLAQLLAETVNLQDVDSAAVAALQSEVQKLRLPQLLRLHILHLQSDGHSSAHAAFLARLEILVYEMLGEKALQTIEAPELDQEVLHSLGMELTLLFAVSRIELESKEGDSPQWPPTPWWATSIPVGTSGLFFNADSFLCSTEFPGSEVGVIQARDNARQDTPHRSQIDLLCTVSKNSDELAALVPFQSQQENKLQGEANLLEDFEDPLDF